jgi:hypothetical protein
MSAISPVMRVAERSELAAAYMICDADAAASAYTVGLYRFDSSGSSHTAQRLAAVDGGAASATAWIALRPKAMSMPTAQVVLNPGDVIALVFATPWTGALSMRFRRLPS